MGNEINWSEAVSATGFVKFETDKEKILVITNWKLEKRDADDKIAPNKVEFISDVIEEDGVNVEAEEKQFTTTSVRLKKKLKPILENLQTTEKVKLSILKVGEQFDTQYSVRKL